MQIIFTASETGPTIAKVTFNYNMDDKPDSVTKSFTFDIFP